MLSYQHIYHAGNLADVQKHALLARMLDYLTQKDKPLSYIETHSGRGLYQLDSAEALRTGEAAAGIEKAQDEAWFDAMHPLSRAVGAVRARHGKMAYPGSPLIAANLLRDQDKTHLAELHPREHTELSKVMADQNARVYRQDGYALAHSLLPPIPRRGLLLIDPSYEVKTEFDRLPGLIANLHRKWNVGVIALWYPVLADGRHRPMIAALEQLKLPKTIAHEVHFPAVKEGHRMTGSGMFIINAPFGLIDETRLLDQLFKQLSANQKTTKS
ncbi:MAG: 23S rRNA (adenine(2030)-N(6))-methyltransferase RlmJ [Ruegeria sp.]